MVKHNSIRVLLAITTFYYLELDQKDVKTTFFHGKLDEDIFMTQLKDFIEERIKNMVC